MQYQIIRKNNTHSSILELLLCVIISILVIMDSELWYLVPLFFLLVCMILRPVRWVGMFIGSILGCGGLFVFLAGLSEWKEMSQAGYHFTSTIDLLLGTLFMSFFLSGSGYGMIRKYYFLQNERKKFSP